MSQDYRQQLIRTLEVSLVSDLETHSIEIVTRKLITVLSDYEITKRSTDIIIYDDENERLIKRYVACLLVDGKSSATIKNYRWNLIRFTEFIRKPLKEITAYDIRYFMASEKERGNANSSIENTRSYLNAFYHWMAEEEIIQKNPCAVIKPVKIPDEEKLPFTDVQIDALRQACADPRERAVIETLSSSGVRVAELCNLDIADVDFNDKIIRVRNGKGGKDRTVYITDVAKLYIQKYLDSRKDNFPQLINNKNYERMRAGGIRNMLKTIGKRAEVDNVHPHRFRRTLATNLARRGMPVQEIQKILGHSNIQTTMMYVCTDTSKVQASYRQHIS